jgi:CRP/FNR family transcriptional regulator, cyclic AMP receptor protein
VDRGRISALALFAGLPAQELDALAGAASWLEVEPGQAIATERDFGHALFVIESGTAEIVRDGAVVATVGPDDLIGEMAVLSSGRRTASIVPTTAMRLVALFKRDVWELERRAPQAMQRLRTVLDERRGAAGRSSG